MITFENSYLQVRAECLASSTRDFLARGKSVVRCERCQLASYACLCNYRQKIDSRVDFILLMHSDEVFKPTNTGRLIADLLPAQTHVFVFNRTQPQQALLTLLADPLRDCRIVFPGEPTAQRLVTSTVEPSDKRTTFILLDGTWKQSSRMYHSAKWLAGIPCLAFNHFTLKRYAVRKSHQEHFMSTFEAIALCLEVAGECSNSDYCFDYFELFNMHYVATRVCCAPKPHPLHDKMRNTPIG